MFQTLISTGQLAEHVDDPDWVIIDCRFDLADPGWGRAQYAAAHVPGAMYADLDRDLAGQKTGRNGRHPLPDWTQFASRAGGWGIGPGVQVVAYDQTNGMYASRLWWMLRYLGHDAVAVLDGGFRKWIAEGRETGSGDETRPTATFTPKPHPEMAVTADRIAAQLGRDDLRLVDARAPERFAGTTEPLDRVAGHIPGAVNYFYQESLAPDATFLPPPQIEDLVREAIGTREPRDVVVYCGSGVTACHALLAFEHAGIRGAKLYPGSWSEWSSDPGRPVETSDR